jgi:formylglycine-generating enzyme required for sulfatase activity
MHAAYFVSLMAKHNPLKLEKPVDLDSNPPCSWMTGGAHFSFYTNYGDPRLLTVEAVNGFDVVNIWDDMAGNIWEWLADLYVDVADDKPTNTPTGKPAEINRMLVGGSFRTGKIEHLLVVRRHDEPPDLRPGCLGFRIAI